jgi:propionyl-CoA synthetase
MTAEAGAYRLTYDQSLHEPEKFWMDAAASVDWITPPTVALDDSAAPVYRWFPGAELNTCFNAVDRHVLAGRGEQTAVIYDSAMTGMKDRFTYSELLHEVSAFAGVLRDQGVTAGDRVIIYLPMIPQAIFAMLACARLGAVHSVVFGGFAAHELAVRIDDAKPTVLVTASGGLEPGRTVEYLPLVAEALELSHGSIHTVIVKERRNVPGTIKHHDGVNGVAWLDWDDAVAHTTPAECVPVLATDPLYVLYTSGTTGNPKGIVRDNGGHAVALTWSMQNIYNILPGEVMWAASDVGWVVGHSYIVYAPLFAGATTVIYEGKPVGTPDAGAFWRIVDNYKVSALFTAPTALRAIRRVDPGLTERTRYDISSMHTLFMAGERLDTETLEWASDGLGIPVVDHWWQTETGWPITANPRGIETLPIKPGSSTVPVPGYQVEIVDSKGRHVARGEEGNIVIKLPMPPGTLAGLWGRPEGYQKAYLEAFPGYYATGDSGYVDEDGYVFVMGRTDDVINVAGHRLSTGQLEEALAQHPDVAECAVIGVKDELKGQRASGFVTLKAGVDRPRDVICSELVALVREKVGPVAAFRDVLIVERLPKTRSGKILRKTMRQIVDGEDFVVPPTIEDVTVLEDLTVALMVHPESMISAPRAETTR